MNAGVNAGLDAGVNAGECGSCGSCGLKGSGMTDGRELGAAGRELGEAVLFEPCPAMLTLLRSC